MASNPDRLYELLPALYREVDARENRSLHALLRIIGEQAALVERDIEGWWDNLFVETCQPWVIPYIGDLVSNDLLYDADRLAVRETARALFPDLAGRDLRPPLAARARADVAKTIYYRRRKGTPPILEEIARDVTGWPAHVVEFFQLLGWTQHREHRRVQTGWTDVRSPERLDRVDGPFDETSHTVDVRRVRQLDGWHNIHNVGFFLWRLGSYALEDVPARPASEPWRYHFSPLNNPAPLFARWRREGDEAGLATELHVAAPIRRALFHEDLTRYQTLQPTADSTELYGSFVTGEHSFFIRRNGSAVAPTDIACRRLDPWPAAPPPGRVIAVDVERGRMAVGDGWGDATTRLDVSFHYGFSAGIGGGPYDRRKWLVRPELATVHYRVKEDGVVPPGAPPPTHTSLTAALGDWDQDGRLNTIITVLDSRTYALPDAITLRNDGWLAIEAAHGERPLLTTEANGLALQVLVPADAVDRGSALTVNGVVVQGSLRVTGDLARLRILHSTLIPGRGLREDGEPDNTGASVEIEGGTADDPINERLRVELAFSITGALVVPEHAEGVWALDCIVDGVAGLAVSGQDGHGPTLTVERTTILGGTRVKALDASETIFTDTVDTVRTQEGCLRFSYVPPGSRTPRRYRCQPDLAAEIAIGEAVRRDPGLSQAEHDRIRGFVEAWLVPSFTARRYGQPAYAQLHLGCPEEIKRGAEDGAEMGAFSHLKQPQREGNLRIRLREYLPFGLEAGIIYVT
jgi:hypothetical protein